jgi:ribosome maturation factor RimP
MIQASQIEQLANEHLASRPELFLVDIKVKIGNKISIRIDSDSSVLIEDCKSLSKFIEENLDREKDDFELEVSSAGIDFPLVNTRQYTKNLGRTVQVMTTEGNLFKGSLVSADSSQIIVANEKKQKGKKALIEEVQIENEKIKEIKVIISFM